MARRVAVDEEWEDEDDGEDESDDDEDETIPCPYCHRPIYEGAERCPHCESYISEEDTPRSHKPWWIVLGVVLCLLIVYMWIRRGQ